MSIITQLIEGYVSEEHSDTTRASGSVTLIENDKKCLLFDCGDPWNGEQLKESLYTKRLLKTTDITNVIISHWHIDHTGNLGIFDKKKLRTSAEEFDEIEKMMNIKVGVVKDCHSSKDVYIIAFDGKHYTLIAGDLFENENDIWDMNYWCCQSKNIPHQKLQRYLLSKNVSYIIPGHGPTFEVTDEHKKKLYDDIFKNSDSVNIYKTINNKHKCYIEGPDYHVVINDWTFETNEEYEKITHLIITHNNYDYFVNINNFSNAKLIMDNDITTKNSYFPNELNQQFKREKALSIGNSVYIKYNGEQLTVVAISNNGDFFTIVD
uniref:Metallo-beta-lactamase domain-containing protein 1 n=1 Tax=Strongyloides venezuelensis TaxID=75913 RepID=A0A0K0EYA0_STRVS